jgi:hypothetical protein
MRKLDKLRDELRALDEDLRVAGIEQGPRANVRRRM